jgi:hypothetical protein
MPLSERTLYLVAGAKVAFVEETLFRGDLLGRLRVHAPLALAHSVGTRALAALGHRGR